MRAVRRHSAALLGLAVLAPGPAAAIDVDPYWLDSIPAEYRGSWNRAPGTCAPFTGRHRLTVSAEEIVVGGDRFVPEYIRWHEEGGIGLVSRYVGPAGPWTRVDYLRVSADGKVLTNEHARRTIVRTRCPQ